MATTPRDQPATRIIYHEGEWWRPLEPEPGWIALGVCPEPRSRTEAVLYHVLHGLLMCYSVAAVLRFAWRNRASFG